jgi:hypothetical protein
MGFALIREPSALERSLILEQTGKPELIAFKSKTIRGCQNLLWEITNLPGPFCTTTGRADFTASDARKGEGVARFSLAN